ncbi:MAG TPA: universal stress protein [Actinospica sp.]|jgi:nucleotide-binding universal stress UspA family protein|nr:universal stress protein [Actinospica sp.]
MTTENSTTDADPTGIRRVVVGVDGSESALHAAFWAAAEAESRGVPLTLEHAANLPSAAVAPLEPDEYAERQQAAGAELMDAVAAQIRERHPGLAVDAEISPLSPTHRLTEVSAPDVLIVTGTRGHGGFTGMLLGSVSRALAAHANGPLVVVRGPAPEDASGTVVLGVGPSPAESAIDYAFAAALRHRTSLHVVRAWMPQLPIVGAGLPGGAAFSLGEPGGLFTSELRDSNEDETADAVRAIESVRDRYPQVKVEVTAVTSNPVPALTDAASDARLIVVGAHRRRGPFAVGAGYVVEGLLSHSPAPVAVVPVDLEHAAGDAEDEAGDAQHEAQPQ